MYKKKQSKDLKFGSKSEEKVKPLLEDYFDLTIKKTKDKYATYDYYSDDGKVWFELKTRRAYKTQYFDTMMGYNKINNGWAKIDKGCDVYLCFQFTDKLCYYKLEKETFKEEWVRDGGRFDRGKDEISKYAYIPTSLLIDIVKKEDDKEVEDLAELMGNNKI